MVSIPLELTVLAFVIIGWLILLFFDIGYTLPRLGWRGHLAVLAAFAVSLAAFALLPDWNDPIDRIIAPSHSVLFAVAIAALTLRNGHLDRFNPPRAAAFAIAAVYLAWSGFVLLQADFSDGWPDVNFRTYGGKSSWMTGVVVYLGKLLQWLGNDAAVIPVWAASVLAGLQAVRLSRRPDRATAAKVMAQQYEAERLPPAQPAFSETPDAAGGDAAHWWNRHLRGRWQDPDCRALLRSYCRLGGPYFSGTGIRLRDDYLHLDTNTIARLLDGGGLRFGSGSGRFALSGRGRVLMSARPGSKR